MMGIRYFRILVDIRAWMICDVMEVVLYMCVAHGGCQWTVLLCLLANLE